MGQTPVDLVTVSREYGAGGSEFAKALGERLGWRVFDREIVSQVAERLHVRSGVVEQRDEQPPGMFSRIAATLLIAPPEAPMQYETGGILSPDCIAEAAEAAIRGAAASPPVIIVGHGAQFMFRDRPGTFQVRLIAPVEARLPRIIARDGGTEQQAAAHARRMDHQRQAYVQRYYHHSWSDETLFDAQFNTGRVAMDEVVATVASMLASRGYAHVLIG